MEFDLIARYFTRPTPRSVLGPGDDGALLFPTPGCELVVTTDMLVSGTHFFPDADPRDLGWKTLAVNLSDLAAMGATPRWVFLALALPEADEPWLAEFSAGLFACAERFQVDLAGGDTTRGPLNLALTALGEAPRGAALRRSGGKAGDDLWVSGQPGRAALGLMHRQGRLPLPETARASCLAALHRPMPRVELGRALVGLAHAAVDISDGLLADLGHLVRTSGLAATLTPHAPAIDGVPVAVAETAWLSGGDDYELGFAAPPAHREAIERLSLDLDLPLTRIGSLHRRDHAAQASDGPIRLVDAAGTPLPLPACTGYDHFGRGTGR